jgi:thiol-disulfide isomerase/thioredoxin
LVVCLLAGALPACRRGPTAAPFSADIPVVGAHGVREEVAQRKGEVVLLNFWATWCQPCIEEMPHFARLVQKHGDRGLHVVAVCVDEPDTLDSRVRPFIRERRYPFRFLLKEEMNGEQFEAFVNSVSPAWSGGAPATFVYDRTGALRAAFYEGQTFATLEAAVLPLL